MAGAFVVQRNSFQALQQKAVYNGFFISLLKESASAIIKTDVI